MKDYTFTQFGRYTLTRSLGEGGMGRVFLSLYGDPNWEKFCAIKRLLPQSGDSDALLRFRSEVDINLRLNHSNIVSVFDVGIVDQQAYMAMELVEGENLRSLWVRCAQQRTPFPMDVALFMVKESAKALSYAHHFKNLNLVHRDISPSNLMLTFSGEMKVLDFGLALSSSTKRLTKPGLVYGKIPYLSPEQARGELLTGKSDIYSLGIVLWELITGRRLFEAEEKENSVDALKTRGKGPEIRKPSVVSGRGDSVLDQIVLSMLHPDPFQRPKGEQVIKALGTYLGLHYPGTDTQNAAQFMENLFGEARSKQEEERQEILHNYRSWKSSTLKLTVQPGDLIAGRYLINGVLGEGAMGKVYEAVQESIGRRVAVKILEPKSTMAQNEAEIRFKREAKAISRISHPSVVSVMDYGFIAGYQPFLVMELLEGASLTEVLRKGPLETSRGCRLGAQLARGIHAAHEAGLIHRDVKPDNMHLTLDHNGEEQIKLLDFGISKSSLGEDEDLTRPGTALGTPEYIAPELLLGEKPTTAADVYSFGAVLYEFFTGSAPYRGRQTTTIIQNKLRGKHRPISRARPDLPIELQRLVDSCLSQDPRKRPPSLAGVAEKLDAIHDRFANPLSTMLAFTPAPAQTTLSQTQLASTQNLGRGESGSWLPLGLALMGVLVFLLGILQVGKPSVTFRRFPTPPAVGTLLRVKTPPTPTPTPHTVQVVKQPAPPVATPPRPTRHRNRGLRYLSQAKLAFNQGQYPKASVLAKRSMRYGGGAKARRLHKKAQQLMGLKQ